MRYAWDPEKNRENVAGHGIAFDDAIRIFEGPTLERIDDRYDYGEIRVYAVGVVNGVEITVIGCVGRGAPHYLGVEGRTT